MVRPHPRSLVPLVLLLLLAGCSGAPADDPSTVEPVTTPAPVPTDDLRDGELAPGVTSDGIVDPERLAEAHDAYLSNTSYLRRSGSRYRYANGTLLFQTTFNWSVDPGTDRQLLRRDQVGRVRPEEHYAEWANGTVVVERMARNDSVRYHRRPRTDRTMRYHSGAVAEFVADQDPRVVGQRQANGTTEYVLVAGHVDEFELLRQVGGNRTSDQRLVAVVTREGLVRSIRITAHGTYEGARIRVQNYFYVTEIGEAEVDRPPWLADGLNATSESSTETTG